MEVALDPGMLAVVAAVGVAAGWTWWRHRRVRAGVEFAIEPYGLSADAQLRVTGSTEGFDVVLDPAPPNAIQSMSCCTVQFGFALPAGTQVRTRYPGVRAIGEVFAGPAVEVRGPLSGVLVLRGDERLASVFEDAAVVGAVRAIADVKGQLVLREDRLVLWEHGNALEDPGSRLDRALVLSRALEAVWRKPWDALIRQHNLREETAAERVRLVGEVDGVPLVIQQHRPGDQMVLRVTAQLRAPLPAETLLVHPDRGRGPPLALADPILDGRVHGTSSEPEGLAGRLCRDRVRGPLLEVVHGNPGSTVSADRIGLMVKPAPLDPRPAVDLVLELERALAAES